MAYKIMGEYPLTAEGLEEAKDALYDYALAELARRKKKTSELTFEEIWNALGLEVVECNEVAAGYIIDRRGGVVKVYKGRYEVIRV